MHRSASSKAASSRVHPQRARWLAARRLLLSGTAVALPLGLGLTAGTPAGATTGNVSLVAYSTPKPAYAALSSAFNATKKGSGVTISPSFGPSGTEATSVVNGLPANVVNFSSSLDMAKLVKAGLVAPTWDAGPTKGIVTDSIVSFVVRKGNPKHIETWADLTKPGIGVVTPNVFSSGSAKWNLLAAYGAELALGKSKTKADAYLAALLRNTVAQPSSASAALQTFLAGQGDVLLDYEDDARYAEHQGEPIAIVTPPQSILIQNPIAVTKTAGPAAKAFESYLLSPAGQTIWAKQGYRPVLPSVAAKFHFPKPTKLFTIAEFGGWTKVNSAFFDPQTGVVTHIEQTLGVSTSSG